MKLETFEDDWMEVEVVYEPKSGDPRHSNHNSNKRQYYKRVYLDVDLGKKSERQEWGHLQYQEGYRPNEAFELVVQWVQATGSIVAELVRRIVLKIISYFGILIFDYRSKAGHGRRSSATYN